MNAVIKATFVSLCVRHQDNESGRQQLSLSCNCPPMTSLWLGSLFPGDLGWAWLPKRHYQKLTCPWNRSGRLGWKGSVGDEQLIVKRWAWAGGAGPRGSMHSWPCFFGAMRKARHVRAMGLAVSPPSHSLLQSLYISHYHYICESICLSGCLSVWLSSPSTLLLTLALPRVPLLSLTLLSLAHFAFPDSLFALDESFITVVWRWWHAQQRLAGVGTPFGGIMTHGLAQDQKISPTSFESGIKHSESHLHGQSLSNLDHHEGCGLCGDAEACQALSWGSSIGPCANPSSRTELRVHQFLQWAQAFRELSAVYHCHHKHYRPKKNSQWITSCHSWPDHYRKVLQAN